MFALITDKQFTCFNVSVHIGINDYWLLLSDNCYFGLGLCLSWLIYLFVV